ncbi:MAG: hypothetical protein RIG61_07470 [Deltaproteobacteria bacterium]
MLRRKGLRLAIIAGLSIIVLSGGYDSSHGQDVDCTELSVEIKEAEKGYKDAHDEQVKAFRNWDKYYKQLHSDTYAGSEKPIADTAEECESGEDHGGDYCKGTLEEYEKLTSGEQEAKAELDVAKKNAAETYAKLDALKKQAKENNCE